MTVAQNKSPRSARPYRVVQWATGNIGKRSLRAVIEHPNLSLVGLYVHSEAKAGRDAGELCGIGPVGVKATRNIDEIIALEADCCCTCRKVATSTTSAGCSHPGRM